MFNKNTKKFRRAKNPDIPAPMTIATKTFYWKPAAALFRALEFRAYQRIGNKLKNPVLDIGCGDGTFAGALREIGVIETPFCGLDLSAKQLSRANRAGLYDTTVQADANRLPFADESFESIFSNGTLCGIPGGAARALSEASRVLRPGGIFVATIPSDKFVEKLIVPKILNIFSKNIANWYVAKLNYRLEHRNDFLSDKEWVALMEEKGFSVEKISGFLSQRAGYLYSIINMHVFRVFGLLRKVGNEKINNALSGFLAKCYKQIYEHDDIDEKQHGYLLILARKNIHA